MRSMLFRLRHGGGDRVILALPPGFARARAAGLLLGLRDWLIRGAVFGYHVDLVDMSDLAAVRAAMKPDTSLSGSRRPAIRSGTSPTSLALRSPHAGGAMLGVDSTVATAWFSVRSRSAPTL